MKISSTAKEIKLIEILGNKVYIRSNIERVIKNEEENQFDGWEYDEQEICLIDYLEKTKSDIDYLAIMTGVEL